jgi:hypothetical protein
MASFVGATPLSATSCAKARAARAYFRWFGDMQARA